MSIWQLQETVLLNVPLGKNDKGSFKTGHPCTITDNQHNLNYLNELIYNCSRFWHYLSAANSYATKLPPHCSPQPAAE